MNTIPTQTHAGSTPASRIFHHLHHAGSGKTKRELSEELHLSLPTVYQALSALMAENLVEERADRSSTGGRPASSFYVKADGYFALGVSATGSLLRTAVCDLIGNEIETSEMPMPLAGEAGEVARHVRQAALDLLAAQAHAGRAIVGVGIALPAIIDPRTQDIVNARPLGFGHAEGKLFTAGMPCPVRLLNDANSGGYAETMEGPAGAEPVMRNAAFLSLERGVGGALLVGGIPYEGANGRSGEFGHLCVEPGGRACTCGKRGCLQAYCSIDCLAGEATGANDSPHESGPAFADLGTFFAALAAGNQAAQATWESFAEHLARGIADIRMMFDADVIIGGMLAPDRQPWLEDIRSRTLELCPFDRDASFVQLARHPRFGIPLGAARQVMAAYTAKI